MEVTQQQSVAALEKEELIRAANALAQTMQSATGLTNKKEQLEQIRAVVAETAFDELFDCIDVNEPVEQAAAAAAPPGCALENSIHTCVVRVFPADSSMRNEMHSAAGICT